MLTSYVEVWLGSDKGRREELDERAAIFEYDGKMSRANAEREALEWLLRKERRNE